MMQQVENWGMITIRRVYGNEETLRGQRWKELCLTYALQPIPHIGISGAKNATDIALTVDAMDLLWHYRADKPHFCLITGDQDFTALVLRLRNQGCNVYCIGRTTKAEALAKVCTQFLPIEHVSTPIILPLQEEQHLQSTHIQKPLPVSKKEPPQTKKTKKSQKEELDATLTKLLRQTAEKIRAEKKVEWIALSHFGSKLKQLHGQFQAKTYGYKNLHELIESQTDLFEKRQLGMHLELRLKEQTKKKKK